MSALRTLADRLSSRTFLAGLLCGAVLGAGGFKLYAVVAMQMAGGDGPPEQARYLAPIEPPDSAATTARGTVSESWTLRSLDGNDKTTFGTLQKRPTLLTIGATWCDPCTAELSTLQALHDTTGKDVRVAFVSPEPRDSLRRHVQENGYSMPAYVVDDLPSSLDGEMLPRTYLIRSNGTVVYRHVGPADWNADATHRLLDRVRSSTTAHQASGSVRGMTARRKEP